MASQKPKILALIPARSGSKGIKDKNIRDFCGKPLIAYTIEEARKSKKLDRIIVSTDSPRYADTAKSFGAEIPYLRPENLAQDKSLAVDVVIELLASLKKNEEYVPDYILLLQTTSPLRTVTHIDESIDLVLKNEKKCDGLVSVCSTEQLLYTIEDGVLKLLNDHTWVASTNRQSLPKTYKLNGSAIYLIKTDVFIKNKSFIVGNILGYIMPKWISVDLDNEEDFVLAEIIYKNKEKLKKS